MNKAKTSENKENYLNMPNHIRNISRLGFGEKELLAHIYSFGRKGCWQNNETLGKMFFRKTRTMTNWIANLKKGGHILWVNGKGYYRTLYAKTHPDVKAAMTLLYRGREIQKSNVISGQAESAPLRKNLPGNSANNCEVTAQKPVIPLRNKLLPTNNTTNKETIKEKNATPPPLPAGGQAQALLENRKAEQGKKINRFKNTFGKLPKSPCKTPEQMQRELKKQIKAFRESEQLQQTGT